MKIIENEAIKEFWKKVSEWEVWFDNNEVRIEVMEKYNLDCKPEGIFIGVSNTGIQAKGASAPYKSIRNSKTEMEALADAINGISAFYSENSKLIRN